MKRWIFSILATWSSFASLAFANVAAHTDYRKTVKLLTGLDQKMDESLTTSEAIARAYLVENAARFGVSSDLKDLKVDKIKKSLVGEHVYFQQYYQGIPIETAEIIISVNVQSKTVYQVFNNYFPIRGTEKKSSLLSARVLQAHEVYDIAWRDLHVHGNLLSDPNLRKTYVVENGIPRLVYKSLLKVEQPFGAWEHTIDARTGRIIRRYDTRIERIKHKQRVKEQQASLPLSNRDEAFQAFYAAKQKRVNVGSFAKIETLPLYANGSAFVFDPDPRTFLASDDLADESAAELFDAAYQNKALLDITLEGGVYTLQGPWVKIVDFEGPNTAPSTSTTGAWGQKRGDNAFNDAMTYYHLDHNQRYMQSLGFVGGKGIQNASIEVDSDAVNGQDNSYFMPSTNQLAFGHGCVDDNEDADVILHEYNHAINYDINENFIGGDTGAMGEGFGDYWAGSYSLSTTNGKTFHPATVFTWDGGTCWPGRRLDVLTLIYNHDEDYGAHQEIEDGLSSDELWSTPLFQSLLELVNRGVPREEVDTIILEAQFGLGSGIKMRDMANAIVLTARRLYPAGPHADVFKQKFIHHEIIDVPAPRLFAGGSAKLHNAGSNGVADPGETVGLELAVMNRGTVEASTVDASLVTTTAKATVVQANSTYSTIQPGATELNQTMFEVQLADDFTCGDKVELELALNFTGGPVTEAKIPFVMGTGIAVGADKSATPELAIPDNDANGTVTTLTVTGVDGVVTANFNVDIALTHTYIGDLEVVLESPQGTKVILHARSGNSDEDIVGNYPGTLTPYNDFSALVGQPLNGTWKLHVADFAHNDLGTLNSWGIKDITGYKCE